MKDNKTAVIAWASFFVSLAALIIAVVKAWVI